MRVPGSGSGFITDGETGTVIALGSPYASAAARGEAIVDAWLRQKGSSHD